MGIKGAIMARLGVELRGLLSVGVETRAQLDRPRHRDPRVLTRAPVRWAHL